MSMPARSANENAYGLGYATGYYGTMYGATELFGSLSVGTAASRSKMFYTVQGSEDAARLLSGGSPWPATASRAALGEGVYAFDNIASARAYQSLKASRGISAEIMPFEIKEFNLNKI